MRQNDTGRCLSQDHEQYTDQQSQHKRCMNSFAGLFRTACSQIPGDDDIGPQGQAQKQGDK